MPRTRPGRRASIALVLALAAGAGAPLLEVPAARAQGKPRPAEVEEVRATWAHPDGKREVPVKLYVPAQAGPRPVVLLSHGLGGTREALAYLARPWAEAGWLCVAMQHPGSDDGVWRDLPLLERMAAMRRAAADPFAAWDRARDVRAVLDRLEHETKAAEGPLAGRVDLARVAIAGHSFGAWTALTAGGRRPAALPGRAGDLSDRRVRCVVSLSGAGFKDDARERAAAAGLRVPTLHMTGTLDTSPVTDATVEDRKRVFRHAPGPGEGEGSGGAAQYLVVLEGGDHMVFSGESLPLRGRLREGNPAHDARSHALIRTVATRFLEAHLLGQAEAQAWLAGDGLLAATRGLAAVERKVAPPSEAPAR